jgi:hypothetical protein
MILTKQNKILGVVLIAVILSAILLVTLLLFRNKAESHKFVGKVKSMEGNTIIAEGVFISPENPDSATQRIPNVRINITPQTKFTKNMVILPTKEELVKTGGYFDGTKLKRESVPGSFEILGQDIKNNEITIEAGSSKNIYHLDSFTADSVFYEMADYGR